MPFIIKERREIIDNYGLDGIAKSLHQNVQVGDRCYSYYKPMVDHWKADPRWTTAHEIYKDMNLTLKLFKDIDNAIAYELAWQVFFQLYVMPYELKKREENGDI